VTPRVSPTDEIRAEIHALFAPTDESRQLGDTLEEVARIGARLLLQTVLEAEIAEFLGRNRYERRAAAQEARSGSRNGHSPFTVKTTAGAVTLKRQKLRGTTEVFSSRLLGKGVTRTNALESLVIGGYVRGLSTRDIEATLAEALGPEASVSKSTVSHVCQAIRDEFDAFRRRDLSQVELEYLFLDGSHFKFHAGADAEPVLVAWGITTTGTPVLLHLAPGAAESTDAWAGFLDDMAQRGLRPPLLVISDRAPGLMAAVTLKLSKSLWQSCVIHRCRNLLTRVPKHAQGDVKKDYWAIFDGIEAAPGLAAQTEARRRQQVFSAKWRKVFPSAVECLEEDFEHLISYLRFPKEHWVRIRHSNFIERTFGETRRRVKVIGRLPGEQSCLSLVWAVLDRASRGWRGVKMTPAVVRHLQELRHELIGVPDRRDDEEVVDDAVTAAA
jgi:putative transposase